MSKYISVSDTAKLVRSTLKADFPNTKFSVRSSSYSGGASITVSWTDGPTERQVTELVGQYSGSTFDGMQDLRSYHTSVLNGETVHYGADHVFGNRETSIIFKMQCAKAVAAYFNQPVPAMTRYNWFEPTHEQILGYDTLIDLITQVMNVTNGDDYSLHGSYVPDWIAAVWMKHFHTAPTPELLAIATPDEGLETLADEPDLDNQVWDLQHPEDEQVDETPCVKATVPHNFGDVPAGMEKYTLKRDSLRERLASVNVDTLSPLEALTLLYELKRLS